MTDQAIGAPPSEQRKPDLPPPMSVSGPIGWLRENLFASPKDIILTILSVLLIYFTVPPAINWLIINATWSFPPEVVVGDRAPKFSDCGPDGACWIFVRARIGLFLFGFFPEPERWRVVLS